MHIFEIPKYAAFQQYLKLFCGSSLSKVIDTIVLGGIIFSMQFLGFQKHK